MQEAAQLKSLAKLIRYLILTSTTRAGSGHPTSSLSAVELMTALFFGCSADDERVSLAARAGGFFRFDLEHPEYVNNDRLIFSKGHASPLFYALYAAAGAVSEEEMLTLRKFGSSLEGHPTPRFRYTEAATGSLGQGLSIGAGMALNAKYVDKLPYRTFVLLGDSEMSEGSQWEAIEIAAHYKLDNLIGILDVNRLGQRGETMYGHDIEAYGRRIASFGWETILLQDGHSFPEIINAYERAIRVKDRPGMIIAQTVKGKGVSFLEDKDGWHGRTLSAAELPKAMEELGGIDKSVRGQIAKPEAAGVSNPKFLISKQARNSKFQKFEYGKDKPVATRKAYGNALVRIFPEFPEMVVLDAEVSNSTFAETFKNAHPGRFFEMFIAEQNMAGVALGLSRRGKIPFVSSFAAFLTRAFDQIRMSQYADANIKFCGSHAGVSIGEDGPSQMGLEDLAMFRAILGSAVLYPADAISTEKLVEEAAGHRGIVYIRTTRKDTPILYGSDEKFPIGGSKTLRKSPGDLLAVVTAGITLHEALAAYESLQKEGIAIRVIDLYSVKPVDEETLKKAARETKSLITVEDHLAEGGMGDAVRGALEGTAAPIYSLAVKKFPRSGKPEELLEYEDISRGAIIKKVREVLNTL